jgi:outer membrane protein assembly factor BamB
VAQGRIFLTGYDQTQKLLETICLDLRNGHVLWRRGIHVEAVERVHDVSSPAAPTPASDGERVFIYFGSYGLLCYSLDGTELWKHPLVTPVMMFGTGASPIVAGNAVLLNVDQQANSYLLAVDRATGQQLWKQDRPLFGRGWATPVHVHRDGVDEAVVLGSRRLVAYDVSSGMERWSVGGLPPFTISSPLVEGDHLYFAATDEYGEPENVIQPPGFDEFARRYDKNGDGRLGRDEIPADFTVVERRATSGAGDTTLRGYFFATVDVDKDNALSREEWEKFVARMTQWPTEFSCGVVAVRLGGRHDVTQTHVVWRVTDGVPEVPSPLVYQSRVYTVKNGGIVYCREAASGKLIYKRRLGAIGGYYASPVAGDDKIYFASDRGAVVVIKSDDEFEVLAVNELGSPILATPALVDGCVYIRTESQLHAFALPRSQVKKD